MSAHAETGGQMQMIEPAGRRPSLVNRVERWVRGPRGSAATAVAPGVWTLPRDGTLRLRPGRDGMVLRSRGGTLLVTQSNDPKDYVLAGGEEVRLGRHGLVAVWALSDATLAAR